MAVFAFYSRFKTNGTLIVNTAKHIWSCRMRGNYTAWAFPQ